MKKILLLISIILITDSCNNEKFFTEYYPNGNLKLKVQINKDSIQIGTYETYYETGELSSKTNYYNGTIADTLFKYHKNGVIKEKGLVKNNIKDGWWLYYDSDGRLNKKSDFVTVRDSMYKNQSYYYDKNGNVNLEPSTYFELEIPDTLKIGKNAARIKNYVTNYNNRNSNLLSVIIENEYSETETRKDTFGDGTLKPFFGISIYRKGNQKIKGKILEKILTVKEENDSISTLTIMEHYKYFEKDVYVWDKETDLGIRLRKQITSGTENN